MKFIYRALTKEQIIQQGTVEAQSEAEAIKSLHRYGLTILSLQSQEAANPLQREITFFQRIKARDIVVTLRQLSTLVSGKVPIVEALRSLIRSTKKTKLREILSEISKDVEGGSSLSKALAKHPGVFSDFYVNLIRSSEVSGTLESTLGYIADYEENRYEMLSRIRGAFYYPAFIVSFLIIAGVIFMIFVIPQITQILIEAGGEIPLPTKILIFVSDSFRNLWYVYLVGVIAAYMLIMMFFKRDFGREVFDRTVLKVPIFGSLVQRFYLARLADNLSTLLKGGISVVNSLDVSSQVIGNRLYRKILLEAKDDIKSGKSISSAFERYPDHIPAMFTELIKVGEMSGNLDETLRKVADFYQREVQAIAEQMPKLIEPVMLVLIAVGVAGMVAAVILPVYNMVSAF